MPSLADCNKVSSPLLNPKLQMILCHVRQSPWQVINGNYSTCRQLSTLGTQNPRPRPLKPLPSCGPLLKPLCAPLGIAEAAPRLHAAVTAPHNSWRWPDTRNPSVSTARPLPSRTLPPLVWDSLGLLQRQQARNGPAPPRISEVRNVHGRLTLSYTLLDCYAKLSQGCAGNYQLRSVIANYLHTAQSSGRALRGQAAVVTTTCSQVVVMQKQRLVEGCLVGLTRRMSADRTR